MYNLTNLTRLSKGIFHNSAIEYFNIYFSSGKPIDEKTSKGIFDVISKEINTIVVLEIGKINDDKRRFNYLNFFEKLDFKKESYFEVGSETIHIVKKGIDLQEHNELFTMYFKLESSADLLNLEDFIKYNNIDCQVYTYL